MNDECPEIDTQEYFASLIEEAKWEAEEDLANCSHEWLLSIDADGDVSARRTCQKCGRREYQLILSMPEPLNCYIPGEGWRLI
jgi:hypothetical protein